MGSQLTFAEILYSSINHYREALSLDQLSHTQTGRRSPKCPYASGHTQETRTIAIMVVKVLFIVRQATAERDRNMERNRLLINDCPTICARKCGTSLTNVSQPENEDKRYRNEIEKCVFLAPVTTSDNCVG